MAKTRNDQAIAAADVPTDFIEINPVYQERNSNESDLVDYYPIHKTVAITLRDVARFERLLAAVLTAGATGVYGVDFQTSELRKYRDQARELAVKAAIEKATAMASAYGRSNRASNIMQNVSPNVISSAPGGDDVSGTMAPGRISVHASVSLTFRLIP
ncbi:MAG: SIMPL domain-containing protein [Acidobacteria bacterium]|nr:SIMPL domain-containing protein [Acidobacteriota bacterium]